jgi:hypothetical protein
VLSNDEPESGIEQQLNAYEIEPRSQVLMQKESPIPYWLEQRRRWPQLARLALDVFSTPVMSDEQERSFSEAGALIDSQRRSMLAHTIEQTMCLRSWQRRGLFTWSRSLFEGASTSAQAYDEATDNRA